MWNLLALLLLSLFLSLTLVKSEEEGCLRPILGPLITAPVLQHFSPPGMQVDITCVPGYTPRYGLHTSGVIICTIQGTWSPILLACEPKTCPSIEPPINGDMYLEDNVYQSTINFTCNKGYNLHGASSAVCQENATWSASSPKCKAVTCGPAPVPDNARIEYQVHRVSGGNVEFGTMGIYKCLPPMVLIGNPRAECTFSGQWTEAPVCQFVTCPLPEPIEHGHMSSKSLNNYKDTVRYGCRLPFTIDGNPYVQCLETGQWSSKPSCRAPCTVNIARGRILYNGRKFWIGDLIPNQVYHNDQVYFYCLNAVSSCGYTVPSRCTNGILRIPECFVEPSAWNYGVTFKGLPSEIRQC